jgi:hypothetical protein
VASRAAFALRWARRGIVQGDQPDDVSSFARRRLPPHPNRLLVKHVELLVLLATAGCVAHQPPVLTPVRIDTSRTAVSTGTTSPTAVAGPGTGARTSEMDPLTRVDRMDWPGPNMFRSGSGAPGAEYWQQRADYSIAATLDTTQQRITGTVTIRYANNSPDSLRFVWLQLDQNLYRPGSKGSMLFPADSRWGVRGFRGGTRSMRSRSTAGLPPCMSTTPWGASISSSQWLREAVV